MEKFTRYPVVLLCAALCALSVMSWPVLGAVRIGARGKFSDFPDGMEYAGQWRSRSWLFDKYKYHCDKIAFVGGKWIDVARVPWVDITGLVFQELGGGEILLRVSHARNLRDGNAWEPHVWEDFRVVHIYGIPASEVKAERSLWEIRGLYAGTYVYTNKLGGRREVQDFLWWPEVLTPDEFMHALSEGYQLVRWQLRKIPRREQRVRNDGLKEEWVRVPDY